MLYYENTYSCLLSNLEALMRLFVCYAHVDKWQVKQLVDIFRAAGHDPWFDNRLLPSQDWKKVLKSAIGDCDAFVYVMTPESVASEWCYWEFATAVELGLPIIPILIQAKTQIPDMISGYQYSDLSDGLTPESIAKLMGGITHLAVAVPKNKVIHWIENPSGKPASVESENLVAERTNTEEKFMSVCENDDWKTLAQLAVDSGRCKPISRDALCEEIGLKTAILPIQGAQFLSDWDYTLQLIRFLCNTEKFSILRNLCLAINIFEGNKEVALNNIIKSIEYTINLRKG